MLGRVQLTALAALVPACLAQTYTSCNPLEATCPQDTALDASSFSSSWTSGSSLDGWNTTAGSISFGSNGAEFTVAKAGDAPTIQSDFYIFFGSVEVTMKAAPGQGIVSSIVLESDVLDEIDLEFLGGDTTQVQTNYYGKGYTGNYDRMIAVGVSSPQTTSHTYKVDWTSTAITYSIDGTVVRTLAYAAADGGNHYPQTPMRVKLGVWAGGAPGNPEGTVEWAGGSTDFSQAPFTMYVQSVKITNYSPGSAYQYTDNTGSYQSIKVIDGQPGGVFAPSGDASSSAAPASSTTSAAAAASTSTTVAAGTTVEQSSTAVPSSVSASTLASSAPQLTTIPLQPTTTTATTLAAGNSTTSAGSTGFATSKTSGSPSPSISQVGSSGAAELGRGRGGNAVVALAAVLAAAVAVL